MMAGDLRHRLTIQAPLPTANADAGLSDNWTTVATVWAAVEPLSGRSYFTAQQAASEVTHRVRMRYRTGLRPEMRLLYGTRHLYIEAIIDPGERHAELEVMCREVVGDARG